MEDEDFMGESNVLCSGGGSEIDKVLIFMVNSK